MEIVSEILLLRSTLHPLGTTGHVVIILVHAGRGRAVGAGLVVLVLGVLELEVLDHGVCRGHDLLGARRKDLLQELEVLELFLGGELDIELDVQVAVVVVAERRHTLAVDDLDGIWKELLVTISQGLCGKRKKRKRKKKGQVTYQER